MNKNLKTAALRKLLDRSGDVKNHNSSDPEFKSWKNLCERTLFRVFGENSKELEQFNRLVFFYNPSMWMGGVDYSADHLRCFNRDFETAIKMIATFIEDIEDFDEEDSIKELENKQLERVFISHSSRDKAIVEELIEIIESMGVVPERIFCSSFEGYGIPLGKDFLKVIKDEISGKELVLFVLSKNFYSSPVCLCEMGAAWVLSKEHIPIVIPPFTFDDIEGVIHTTQGMLINDELKYNTLRELVIEKLGIPAQQISTWERKRDRAISRINQLITNV